MGLYDSVDRGKPKPKRLTGPIALCCALFLLFGGLTYWACHYQFRFHAFISDLTDSTRDARSTETFRVTVNGSEADVSIDDLSDLLYLIDKAGAGRTAAAPEEMPYAVIDYGDGSTLEIWKVELVNPSNDWTEGPFFRYTDAKGKSYGYDTDQLRWESVVRLLGERKEGAPAGCSFFCALSSARRFCSPKGLLLSLHRAGGESKGPFSFAKENGPFGTPRERLRLAVSSSNDFCASGVEVPARGVAALELQDDLPLLLLSAVAQPLAALPPYGCGTPLAGAALPIL